MIYINGLISSNFITTKPYAGVQLLREKLAQHDALVVFDDETSEFLGVLTSGDVIERPHLLVIDCLKKKPALTANCKVENALEAMFANHTNVLPVVADDGRFEGLIFKNDLLKALWQKKLDLNAALNEEKEINKLQQEELVRSEKILNAVYDSSKEMQFLVAPDRTMLFFNKSAYDHAKFYYCLELLAGDIFDEFIENAAGKIDPLFEQHFYKAINGEYVVTESEFTSPGYKAWLKTEYNPVWVNKTLAGISVTISNITSRKKNEIRINEQNELMREIIFAQSHIIRQPLTNILALIELLNKAQLSAQNKEMVEYLHISANQLDEAITHSIKKAAHSLKEREMHISDVQK